MDTKSGKGRFHEVDQSNCEKPYGKQDTRQDKKRGWGKIEYPSSG